MSPVGKGQRALIVAPPRTGKTVLLQNIAQSITANHPEHHRAAHRRASGGSHGHAARSVKGEVVSSTFDEPASRHVQVAEMVIEKAKRLVEHGRDVVILDSITRLGRAYNTVVPSSGKVLTGGVDANALQRPKRSSAQPATSRKGSLTIIATALIDTGSRMDEVIFEEFMGTGNSTKSSSTARSPTNGPSRRSTSPAPAHARKSSWSRATCSRRYALRRILNPMGTVDAIEFLLDKLRQTKTNADFFDSMNT